MPVTVEIKAGKRGQKDADKPTIQYVFATNKESLNALVNGKAPQGFNSPKEFFDCARAHKRVLLQAEIRPGNGRTNSDAFTDEFDDE